MRDADRAMSAPGATTAGFLPPSSRVTGTRFWAAARCTSAPTDGEPVKNRRSNGSSEKAAATSAPPVTTSSSVASKYLGAVAAIRSAVCAVTSDILIITRLPAAKAADAGSTTRLTGKFHGPITPTTPSGVGWTSARRPHSRAAGISLVGRIHCATWDLVCSTTEVIPMISVNREAALDLVP